MKQRDDELNLTAHRRVAGLAGDRIVASAQFLSSMWLVFELGKLVLLLSTFDVSDNIFHPGNTVPNGLNHRASL
jgi:hypothetical protein